MRVVITVFLLFCAQYAKIFININAILTQIAVRILLRER